MYVKFNDRWVIDNRDCEAFKKGRNCRIVSRNTIINNDSIAYLSMVELTLYIFHKLFIMINLQSFWQNLWLFKLNIAKIWYLHRIHAKYAYRKSVGHSYHSRTHWKSKIGCVLRASVVHDPLSIVVFEVPKLFQEVKGTLAFSCKENRLSL